MVLGFRNSSRTQPFSDSFLEVLHASLEKRNGSFRRFSDENVRSWPDSAAKPVLSANQDRKGTGRGDETSEGSVSVRNHFFIFNEVQVRKTNQDRDSDTSLFPSTHFKQG